MEKALLVSDDSSLDKVNSLMKEGWTTKLAVPQPVAMAGGGQAAYMDKVRGNILIVLEKH